MERAATSESAEQGNAAVTADDLRMVGAYVGRESLDGNAGRVILGKVVAYDASTNLATIFYENGQREVLERQLVRNIVMMDNVAKLNRSRKRKLDQLAAMGEIRRPNTRSRKTSDPTDNPPTSVVAKVSLPCPLASEEGSGDDTNDDDDDDDDDSSIDSCDDDHNPFLSSPPREVHVVLLPPSSGDINVLEESIPYLFSVYSFLRSFSIQLFLSPFGLDDFVGSLNCTVQNSLLDAIHLSLMQALRRHLQVLSSEDSKLACKCLRYYDWTLLDSLTWPAILVGYLYIMGYMKQLDMKGFGLTLYGGEYYGLPVDLKLKVLQILCDDVVDCAEIRTVLEMRENIEEVDEYSVNFRDPSESGPRRVHPRYSKTSACKNMEALENSVEPRTPITNSKVSVLDSHGSYAAQDGNSDECHLCGMDGMLICCDGCPSAYHSRCIGLNKASLPDGSWFCPECSVNNLGMTSSRIGRGASGAEIFGTDVNGRLFLGTCNYLLVVGTSLNSESLIRYYNSEVVTKVLSVILAAENSSAYADICRGISKYWDVPLIDMQPGRPGPVWDPFVDKEPPLCYPPCLTSSKRTGSVFNDANGVHEFTNAPEVSPNDRVVFSQKDLCIKEEVNDSTIETVDKANLLTEDHDLCKNWVPVASNRTLSSVKEKQLALKTANLTVQNIPSMSVPANFSEQLDSGSGSVVTETSYSSQTVSAERLILLETATCWSVNENVTSKEATSGSNFLTKESVSLSNESRLVCHINDEKCRIISQRNSQLPTVFKPQAYINQYTQGDVAASAAANLAVLASEESKVSESHISSNPRRTVAANTALQMKAFSGATLNFVWPGFYKKQIEIPRERCGWCFACKAASTCKKGCLLNLAATNAIKRSARSFSGVRPVKHVDSHLPTVAAQIAQMEESLRGLIAGPLSDVQYNKQWHRLAREASSCKVLRYLLLELESNIRGIAFCGDWTKLVDDWSVEFPSSASGMCRIGASKKRGPGGKRYKKQSAASEYENDFSSDSWKNVFWWRGGKLLKVLLQKGLPSSLVKKAGRQGGTRRISGIHYPEGSELPRRSRQFAWRASVEMSKNASQLALQVRYLDAHVRWKDLVCPEQSPLDGKGSDADAMAFRNAVICDKRITENKIKYALTFSFQKHLPLRVTKNILEAEKLQNGNEKLWFLESHVPLYLIKEYEENFGLDPMPSSMMIKSHNVLRLHKRKLKDQGGIFSYLMRKVEGPSRLSCASCHQDVFLRVSVRCNTCQGYCHKDCTIASVAVNEEDLELFFTCSLCNAKLAAPILDNKETVNTQLSLKGQSQQCHLQGPNQYQAGFMCMLQSGYHNPSQPVGKMEASLVIRSSVSASNSANKVRRGGQSSAYGLIWKRKKGDDSGKDFRIKNILLKGNEGAHLKVICFLCKEPYRSDLMYICCEACHKWFHADALQLEEAQIFDLVGFKCCQCRRKSLPKCPYVGSNYKQVGMENLMPSNTRRNDGVLSETPKFGHLNSLVSNSIVEDFVPVDDDPLLYSFGKVEPIGEQSLDIKEQLGQPVSQTRSLQKLSVRRPLVNHGKGSQEVYANPRCTDFHESLPNVLVNGQTVEWGADAKEASAAEDSDLTSVSEKLPPTHVEWDISKAWVNGDEAPENMDLIDQLNHQEIEISDDMEYEPQTYFSFTELLAPNDQLDNRDDTPMDNSGEWPFIDFEATCQDVLPCDFSGAYDMGSNNEFGVSKEPVLDEEPCHLCKLNEPAPDLLCEICKMHIHSHCSPWEDCEGTQWRCGGCRDWK